ncbi:hypothetical protein LX15_000305 [Streptoalloteichus tenebrarius]|uniref:Cyclophilin-like domain-containing protein n=1 Tax=Streptoalloteichus tenebrarius (strain ATCC 17920 / DSM 40477 / JCM 4838 / CBS 697.72 / NBRC 16177 / NCIMB 11028 / NRRL B-12390 / A12253. 1 / ISP 5477) TaxID=1933 RepID=A0ABT1HM78_STRSD|nr:hypothetical protein [Streptoalloteichus tenebrarius]MCP2256622.1 hypothetical protein [Streptoalloteichus tenebrarius]
MRVIVTLLALLALLVGCGVNTSGVKVEFDVGLEKAIVDLARSGGSRPLKELAPGDWTSVHVLFGPATGTQIENELGRPVEIKGDGTYGGDYVQDGNLLVFHKDNEITRMVSLGGVAALAVGRYGADVVLRAQDRAIRMTNPDGSPARR